MKHFIITRFNLKNSDWENSKDGEKVLTDEWLNHRFKLFEKYTLPSVINQFNQNFEWFVFFDISTADQYKSRIESIARSYKKFIPIYIDGLSQLREATETQILSRLKDTDDFIITTRLDNDDIIHYKFIETIQNSFTPKEQTLIDLRLGYQLIDSEKTIEYRLFKKPYNPFLSLITHVKNFDSIISKSHHQWKSISNKIVIDDVALWIQIVHNKNMVAQQNRNLKKVKTPLSKQFGVTLPKSNSSKAAIMFDTIIRYPQRLLYTFKMKFRS